MSYKYNLMYLKAREQRLRREREIIKYWDNISKKMRRRYFFYCIILRKDKFKMVFQNDVKSFFPKDNKEEVDKCAKINGIEVCDEEILTNKSVYYFKKKQL